MLHILATGLFGLVFAGAATFLAWQLRESAPLIITALRSFSMNAATNPIVADLVTLEEKGYRQRLARRRRLTVLLERARAALAAPDQAVEAGNAERVIRSLIILESNEVDRSEGRLEALRSLSVGL